MQVRPAELAALAALVLLAGAGCGRGEQAAGTRTAAAQLRHSVLRAPRATAPLATTPIGLARALSTTERALRVEIARWAKVRGLGRRPPTRIELYALYQQRLYAVLVRHPRLRRETLLLLPRALRRRAANIVAARAELARLTTGGGPIAVHVGAAPPPRILLRDYQVAQRRFGVPWSVLAAINFVESQFGRVRSSSSAGAQGPMQFMPSTWAAYGLGGDVDRPADAILGAANYLRASGAGESLRKAVFSYNPSAAYVDAVLRYAREFQRSAITFYELYCWDVFALTRTGVVRATGPGTEIP